MQLVKYYRPGYRKTQGSSKWRNGTCAGLRFMASLSIGTACVYSQIFDNAFLIMCIEGSSHRD